MSNLLTVTDIENQFLSMTRHKCPEWFALMYNEKDKNNKKIGAEKKFFNVKQVTEEEIEKYIDKIKNKKNITEKEKIKRIEKYTTQINNSNNENSVKKDIIKKWLGKTINKTINGYFYEVAILILLDRYDKSHYWYNPKKQFANDSFTKRTIQPDGGLKKSIGLICKGILEIKGYRHKMSGTVDDKNWGIPFKYMSFSLENGNKISVILCGHLTPLNKQLIKLTFDYHTYLTYADEINYPKYIPLYETWKAYNFNGYFSFKYLEQALKDSNEK